MKGRITRTVEEKYTEYKAERDRKTSGLSMDEGGGSSESGEVSALSHSISEGVLSQDSGSHEPCGDIKLSQSCDDVKEAVVGAEGETRGDEEEVEGSPTSSTPAVPIGEAPTPTRARRRFFPSFQSLR